MKEELAKLTSPTTGLPFVVKFDKRGGFTFCNVVKGNDVTISYHPGYDCYMFPRDLFEFSEMVTAREASELLNVSKMRVSQLCDAGKLKFVRVGTSLLISRESIDGYKENRQPGRPAKEQRT